MTRLHHKLSHRYLVLASGLLISVLSLFFSHSVSAATPVQPGLTVSPASLKFQLSKDGDQQTIPINLTNSSANPVTLVADFQGIDDISGRLIPSGEIDATLAGSLRLDRTEITIPANSAQTLRVQFSDTATLAPGGHYATLVLTQQSDSGQLALQSAVSVTLFATKLNGAQPKIELTNSRINGWLLGLPSRADLTFKSTGNVLVVPRAVVSQTSGQKLLANGIVNQTSLPILPGEQRIISTSFRHLANRWLPGRVQISIAYRADGIDTVKTETVSRWYIPPLYPLGLIIATIGVVWMIRAHALRSLLRRIKNWRERRAKPLSSTTTHHKKITITDTSGVDTPIIIRSSSSESASESKSTHKISIK